MRSTYLVSALAGLMLLTGCASSGQTPKFVTNWSQLRIGMSQAEVKRLLGGPKFISIYTPDNAHVPRAREFGDDKAALAADIEAIFGDPELWHYGKAGLMDPSDEAFLVYFNGQGHVVRWRRAMKGPYAATSRPIEPEGMADPVPRDVTPEELWKTPTLQPAK